MSGTHEKPYDDTIFERALGIGDPADASDAIARNPNLARQARELRIIRAALDSYQTTPAAVARVRERILAATTTVTANEPRRAPSGRRWSADDAPLIIRLHNYRDVLAVAAVVVMAIGLGVPGLLQVRERSQRAMCSQNLAQVGQGVLAYSAVFSDSLPSVGWGSSASWAPSDDPRWVTVPNRRHLYPLIQGRHVPPSMFVCPSTDDIPMRADLVPMYDDFIESSNISYANQNMAGARPSIQRDGAVPMMGDDNPLFESGRPLIDFAARRLGLYDPAQQNSRSHRGLGQNLLTVGGMVRWTTTPKCGVGGDNIWTLDGVDRYSGREGPATTTDSHLLK